MFVGAKNVGKTKYLLKILETEYKNSFRIYCHHAFPTILDNKKTYLSRKWILDDNECFYRV